jgi:diacylglycerol kinase family enzyme
MTAPAIAAAAGRARIGVITNPNSRRNLSGFAEMARLLDGASNAHHAVLEKITDIPDILDRFANDGIDVVAVAGGDGTVQAVLTEIYGRRPFQRVPLLAVVPRGTTNMTAADIGLPR